MKKLIKNILIAILLTALVLGLLFVFDLTVIRNQNEGSFQAALIDKVERLQSIEGPKIILIGNSNVCFGVDSQMIEESFEIPVVDMGLHGGLGNAFHEEMVKLGVSEGDIVILSHTSYSDDDTITDPKLALITVEFHKELWPLIRNKDYMNIAGAYPSYLVSSFISWCCGGSGNKASETSSYSRSAFNKYGDVNRKGDEKYIFTSGSISVPQINDICINRINELNDYIKECGGVLLVAAYPVALGEYTPNADEYDSFEKELRARLNCEVISHFTDYFLPYDLYYDTKYHLGEEGTRILTTQLISDLQEWMDSN